MDDLWFGAGAQSLSPPMVVMNAWPGAADVVLLVCRARSRYWRGARRRGCAGALGLPRGSVGALGAPLRSLNALWAPALRPSPSPIAIETCKSRSSQRASTISTFCPASALPCAGPRRGSHPRSCRATSNTCWNGSMSSRRSRTSCRGPTTIAPEPTGGPIPRALIAAGDGHKPRFRPEFKLV